MPNCSAMTSGEWFGSMTPPEPTRIVLVPPATCPITTDVAALGDARHVVMLGQPEPLVAPRLGMPGEIERIGKRLRRIAALENGREVEHGEGDHVGVPDGGARDVRRAFTCSVRPPECQRRRARSGSMTPCGSESGSHLS